MAIARLFNFLQREDGSLHRKAFRSSIWVTVSNLVGAMLSFARSVILARLLTPEIFGQMAVCFMVIRGIEIFTETGFTAALIHRQREFEEARDTAFTLMTIRGVCLALLCLLVSPGIAAFYDQPALRTLVAVLGISFIFTGCENINSVALQKELDFKRITYYEQASGILGFLISVALAWSLRSVWALVLSQLASAAVSLILSHCMIPGRVRFHINRAVALELYGYGKFITGLAVVVYLTRELDNAVIGKLLGMELLGYYVAAYTLANLPSTYLAKLVSRILFPLFSKLQADPVRLRREFNRGLMLLTAVVVPASVGIVVLAPQIVSVLYGSRWQQAIVPLQILAVFGGFRSLWMLNGYLSNATGRPQVDFYVNLARLILMSSLLLPLSKAYGLVGASIAVTAPMVLQYLAGNLISSKLIGASPTAPLVALLRAGAKSAIMALLLLASTRVVPGATVTGLIVLILIGISSWLLMNLGPIRQLIALRNAPSPGAAS